MGWDGCLYPYAFNIADFEPIVKRTHAPPPVLFFFQAEDGIRYGRVTGVQTCALPISPQQAAAAWKEILELEPNHAKALRTLRELYAMAGDFVGLEQLYARLGQQEELVDALLAIADRIDNKAQRLPLVER